MIKAPSCSPFGGVSKQQTSSLPKHSPKGGAGRGLLLLLLFPFSLSAQLLSGGDVAGGYLWTRSDFNGQSLQHGEGKCNLWLGYKAKAYDWRLNVTGKYKDVDSEVITNDNNFLDNQDIIHSVFSTISNVKPFNLSARYDFNWRLPSNSTYGLWTQYDYDHFASNNSSWSTMFASVPEAVSLAGRFQDTKDVNHQLSVGYRGTTLFDAPGWTLRSSADVSLSRRNVCDTWQSFELFYEYLADFIPPDTLSWEMNPKYTDYAVAAALELTDTVSSHLAVGGGVRFKGEGERFQHDAEKYAPGFDIPANTILINQHATGFRFFVEPFLSTAWQAGKWSVNAEYGLRLYNMTTTEKTGHAVALYNIMDKQNPLYANSCSHFTPLANGGAKLTFTPSKHHSFSLTNAISNRLPTNQQAILGFVQSTEYNKVLLGNPNLKPETKILLSLDHTYSLGSFSARSDVSFERLNNQMENYFYNFVQDGRNKISRVTQNIADVSTCKLSETLAWNNQWLKASGTFWWSRSHHHGTGSLFAGNVMNENDWGWSVEAKASLRFGWLIATNIQFRDATRNVSTQYSRSWPSSTATVEKRFGHVTLYLTATSLVNPALSTSKFDANGNLIHYKINSNNDRIVLLGCRWSL